MKFENRLRMSRFVVPSSGRDRPRVELDPAEHASRADVHADELGDPIARHAPQARMELKAEGRHGGIEGVPIPVHEPLHCVEVIVDTQASDHLAVDVGTCREAGQDQIGHTFTSTQCLKAPGEVLGNSRGSGQGLSTDLTDTPVSGGKADDSHSILLVDKKQ